MTIKLFHSLENCREAEYIRTEVFIKEQKFKNEFDDTDKIAYHVVGYDNNGNAVATARFFKDEHNNYHIGRIAVLKSSRGKNIGSKIVAFCEQEIKKLGGKESILSAQVRVKHFYNSLGYTQEGNQYPDEGVPHILMRKSL